MQNYAFAFFKTFFSLWILFKVQNSFLPSPQNIDEILVAPVTLHGYSHFGVIL